MVWKQNQEDKEIKKVVFLPEGGFDKRGALIEVRGDEILGNEPEYEMVSFLTLEVTCRELNLVHSFSVAKDGEKVSSEKTSSTKYLHGKGLIQRSRYGQYRLSMLGSDRESSEINVSIRANEDGEACYFAGYEPSGEFGELEPQVFYAQVEIDKKRFDEIIGILSRGHSSLKMTIRADMFNGVLSTWSPSVSQGRKIKFLDYNTKIENKEVVPVEFGRSKEKGTRGKSPIELSIIQEIKTQNICAEQEE